MAGGLRVECWPRRRRDGTVRIYWQWSTVKGPRKRFYGGSFKALPGERQEAYWRRARQRAERAARARGISGTH